MLAWGYNRGVLADAVFEGCPVLDQDGDGITLLSTIKLPRRDFWHVTMHAWCPAVQARACVVAVLVCELRLDRLPEDQGLPALPYDAWLLILEFIPRHALGQTGPA